MKIGVLALIALVVIGVVFGGQVVSARNEMVVKKNAIEGSWAQVENVLQRRADLIPNLVETVKGITKQAQAVFGEIAQARSGLLGARSPQEKMAANATLDGALGRLLMLTENYPQLKSNENFMKLQDELSGAENRIAIERQKYNNSIQDYNTYIQLFPQNIAASLSGFGRNDSYFKAEPAARTAPKVSF
ncbi:MAG: LemA family protein [Acidobacteria bacterium]|nr:LemA family protein [Acidobacteriota bacterium]